MSVVKRLVSILIVVAFLFSLCVVSAENATKDSISNVTTNIADGPNDSLDENDYSNYLQKYQSVSSISATNGEVVLFEGNQDYKAGDTIEISAPILQDCLAWIVITYKSLSKQDLEASCLIDDTSPFTEAKNLTFPSHYMDGSEVRIDGSGNEFAPEQVLSNEYVSIICRDYAGIYAAPYSFYFSSGEHKITFNIRVGSVNVTNIKLIAPEITEKYSSEDLLDSKKIDEFITIEGEDAYVKSSASLIPLSDDGSCDVSPSSAYKSVINYIGGSNWSNANDTIEWKFNVEKAGYYRLGFLFRQSENLGGISYRHLKIDGKTPFAEAKSIKFKYDTGWQYMDYGNQNEDYFIFLSEGNHTLSLSVTASGLTDINRRLKEVAADLGDLYIDITMVVGETVDAGRSYELFNQIPEFNDRLKSACDRLRSISDELEALQERKGGSNVSIIGNAIETLSKMYENPYSAHKYKSAYYTAYTNLSGLLSTLTNMPLDIDRIFVIGSGTDFEKPTASFFESIAFGIKRWICSFTNDYAVSINKNDDALTVWVSWGRDQTQVLDSLIQSDFVKNENIPVTVKLVNASLIQALLSGKGPDVMLQMPRTEPVNLAMRGALLDLNQFDDYSEVVKQFTEGADIPFMYKGKNYAIPDTMTFDVMFVRTDIFEELGIQVPKTWDEFIYAVTVLQHNNLQAYVPQTLYNSLLLQNDLDLYNDKLTQSNLTCEAQIGVFAEFTELFTKYKLPVTIDFYNRFKLGSVPLGVYNYTLYTQLKAAAPEIDGRWAIYSLPGVVDGNGNINNTTSGGGTGCAITKLSKNPDNAWKLLKWWTKAETQLKYSENLESVLGYLGRLQASNVEALNSMIWDDEMKRFLNEELDTVVQIPEVAGGYYTARGVEQAFWNVTEMNENPTDMMLEWGNVVDREIKRKQLEFAD